jgi:hypothetical protein
MKNNNTNDIFGYFDAVWAESFDRKITSSIEVKYRVMTSMTSELIWIKQLLIDLEIKNLRTNEYVL